MYCPVCGNAATKKVSVTDLLWKLGDQRCLRCGYQANWSEFAEPSVQCSCGHEDPKHDADGCHGLKSEDTPCDCPGFRKAPEEVQGCLQTYEMCVAQLDRVEGFLAKRLNLSLSKPIRDQLLSLDRAGDLEEDEVVEAWHANYASFLHWDSE